MAAILQISDFHFGMKLDTPYQDRLMTDDGAKQLAQKLFYFINNKLNDSLSIDAIIIPGIFIYIRTCLDRIIINSRVCALIKYYRGTILK